MKFRFTSVRLWGIAALYLSAFALPARAERPPKMGWSSYNAFFLWIDETKIKGQADAMVNLGLKDYGYQYINIDDGYQNGRKSGVLQTIPGKFPDMRALTDYIHAKGLKAGIYSDAGRDNCGYGGTAQNGGNGDEVGMYGHEKADAKLFFDEWNFDFVKIDFCGGEKLGYKPRDLYPAIGEAINEVKKPREEIEFNICCWGFPGTWAYEVADSWRSVGDIFPHWLDTKRIIKENVCMGGFNRNGRYNDMDMLYVGRTDGSLTQIEETTQFSMWCLMSSPLMLGVDLSKMPENSLKLITNTDLISINQDELGIGTELVQRQGDVYVLVKDLQKHHGKKRALGICNLSENVETISVPASRVGYNGSMKVRDALKQRETGSTTAITVTLQPHESAVFILSGTRIEQRRYEAENAFMNGYWEILRPNTKNDEGIEIDKNYEAAHLQKEGASNGIVMSTLGYIKDDNYHNDAERSLVWERVWSEKGGRYVIDINYYCAGNRNFILEVNGERAGVFTNVNSGGNNKRASVSADITLKKGLNSIKLRYYGTGTSQYLMPDIDYIDLTPIDGKSEKSDEANEANELLTNAMNVLFDQNKKEDQRYQWSDKYKRGDANGNGNSTIWPQGFGLASMSLTAKALQGTSQYTLYKKYAQLLAAKFPNYITKINNVEGYSVYPNTEHRFLDDNAWAAIGMLDLYDIDRDNRWLEQAELVANYMVTAGRLLENNPPTGGGMYWQDSPANDENTYVTKNTANNAPAVVIFARLYEITGNETYLQYAKQTYKWLYDVLLNKENWLMWDNINVKTGAVNNYQAPYTTGAMLQAASLLYSLTGDKQYKDNADKLAEAAFAAWFENYDSKELGQNIKLVKTSWNTHSDDIVVLMRGFDAYSAISSNPRYMSAFQQSLSQIWATRIDKNTGLMNYDWKGDNTQDEWTTLGQTGYIEMYARMALLLERGFAADLVSYTPDVIEAESTTLTAKVTKDEDALCSGGYRVGFVGNGNSLSFTYNAKEAGTYEVTTYYMTNGNRPLTITVNGSDTHDLNCSSTNSWGGTNIASVSFTTEFVAGANTFIVGAQPDYAPNIDKFEIFYLSMPSDDDDEEEEDDDDDYNNDDQTPIKSINANNYARQSGIYDLSGRYLGESTQGLERGIYIQNGKKIIVR